MKPVTELAKEYAGANNIKIVKRWKYDNRKSYWKCMVYKKSR